MDDKVKLSFDSEYKVRVLDQVKFTAAEELQVESTQFVEKVSKFNDKVHNLVEILEAHAKRIDENKLRVKKKEDATSFRMLTI